MADQLARFGVAITVIRFVILISSVVLVASTLCFQAAADLSSEVGSVQERKLRLRLLTLEPGGVVGLHSHKGRPTVLHVIKGTLTSHPQGKPEVVLRAGDGLAEGEDSNYWVENTGSEPAEFIWLPVYESTPY